MKGRRETNGGGFERRLRAALEHMTRDEAAAAVARAHAEVEALIASGLEQAREICRLQAALAAAEAKLRRARSSAREPCTTGEARVELGEFIRDLLQRFPQGPRADVDLFELNLDFSLREMYPDQDEATLEGRKDAVRKLRAEAEARVEAWIELEERKARTGHGWWSGTSTPRPGPELQRALLERQAEARAQEAATPPSLPGRRR